MTKETEHWTTAPVNEKKLKKSKMSNSFSNRRMFYILSPGFPVSLDRMVSLGIYQTLSAFRNMAIPRKQKKCQHDNASSGGYPELGCRHHRRDSGTRQFLELAN